MERSTEELKFLREEDSKIDTHKQCKLLSYPFEYLCWVPNKLAITGKQITLDNLDNQVWTITEVYDNVNKGLMNYMLTYKPTLDSTKEKCWLEPYDPRWNNYNC